MRLRSLCALPALVLLCGAPCPGQEDVRVLRGEATARQHVYGRMLAKTLEEELLGVVGETHRAAFGDGRALVGLGPAVELRDLTVRRLRFRQAEDALAWAVEVVKPRRTPLVADARGRELVLLEGARLADPALAARVLRAAWAREVLGAPTGPLEALCVASPNEEEAVSGGKLFESVTALGRPGTPAYTLLLERLAAARQSAGGGSAEAEGVRLAFRSTNHFYFQEPGGYSEVKVVPEGGISCGGRSRQRCHTLLLWARDLLEALGGGEPAAVPSEPLPSLIQSLLQATADVPGPR